MDFVYCKRDLIVAGVAMGIIVTMLGLGFGLAKTDAASIGKRYEFIFGPPGGATGPKIFFKPATYCIVCSLSSSNVSHEGVYIFKIDYTSETMSCPSSSMYKN